MHDAFVPGREAANQQSIKNLTTTPNHHKKHDYNLFVVLWSLCFTMIVMWAIQVHTNESMVSSTEVVCGTLCKLLHSIFKKNTFTLQKGLRYWCRTTTGRPNMICILSVNTHPFSTYLLLCPPTSDEKVGEEWNSGRNCLTPVHSIKLSFNSTHALVYFHGYDEQTNNSL